MCIFPPSRPGRSHFATTWDRFFRTHLLQGFRYSHSGSPNIVNLCIWWSFSKPTPIDSKHEEISHSKLVGFSNAYIRFPLVIFWPVAKAFGTHWQNKQFPFSCLQDKADKEGLFLSIQPVTQSLLRMLRTGRHSSPEYTDASHQGDFHVHKTFFCFSVKNVVHRFIYTYIHI